jgi:hypothetical protein
MIPEALPAQDLPTLEAFSAQAETLLEFMAAPPRSAAHRDRR